MENTYFPPAYKNAAFNCPYCGVYTTQKWESTYSGAAGTIEYIDDLFLCTCDYCNKESYWFKKEMIIPPQSLAPLPHKDMPDPLVEDYQEARSIVNLSPRGAAALLRLVLEKLLKELLGSQSENINKDIKALVLNGLPVRVEKALDIIRVVGNNAVHPGIFDLKDDKQTALTLFTLINFIIENQITLPKTLDDLEVQFFSEGQIQHINERERPTPSGF